jgi:serine/threonine-protein kinase
MQLPNSQGVSFLPPGTKLGKYEIIRGVAVGGMAELYLARAAALEEFDRLVALKRILPQYAADEEFVRMFLDEARLTAKLHHPNIAQVYDIGMDTGGLFFTMEFIHGENAQTLLRAADIKGTPVPLAIAVAIARSVAAGLYAAHEQKGPDGHALGIVHRDVSPSNVVVSFDGNVKLIDFGVAKARGRHTKTKSGTIKGKVSYMSPEQCRGESLDHRSDVFSLGILLYELTTTEKLFMADNEFALIGQIAYEDVRRPTERFPDYPRELEAIVMRAMSRSLNRRYQNMRELEDHLTEFARKHSLDISSAALSAYMRENFPDSFRTWEAMLVNEARVKEPGARPRGKRSSQRNIPPKAPNKRDPEQATVRLYNSPGPAPEIVADDSAAAVPQEIAPSVTEPLDADELEEIVDEASLVEAGLVEASLDAASPDAASPASIATGQGGPEVGGEPIRYVHAATAPAIKKRSHYRYAAFGLVAVAGALVLSWAGISGGTPPTAAGVQRAVADSPTSDDSAPGLADAEPTRDGSQDGAAREAGRKVRGQARKPAGNSAGSPVGLTARRQAEDEEPSRSERRSRTKRQRQSRHSGKDSGKDSGSFRLLDIGATKAARKERASDHDWDPDSPLPPP